MENIHNDLCTLFVLRAGVDAKFGKLADDTVNGRAFTLEHLQAVDFLPWQAIIKRLETANFRTVAKLRRFCKGAALGEVDAAVSYLGRNALKNGGRLSRFAIDATLTDDIAVDSDGSSIRLRLHLSKAASAPEKSDCLALFRLLDFLEVDAGKQKHVNEIRFTDAALTFFASL